ncbi:phosphopantothenoylcysteine decarboxylase [Thermaurantimonas aggregans]|uniref:Coenzyme A biosynthesis bifunctional protein CoaBC n=1 Tax=Thermaurantimonas aggregans TaxID=2173829 RepID=A0A401XMN0_9FLAO|nr:bifunctional phosphopantothenoylcysteine decarboxylase/phosphopantothenate--cysteine ligase CoaBC [Thermaurantimonas aggregans]MCX8147716.1 bifunctional phosphopantothenoylcysteine decarboxylase/phosphopantothenate--cysteine ligase CoaBC [Thermaurantimonas aggregans]GCD78261.1 phosphopantothenoylcysteine decarboxylase [Thermaurantimonas aggregans]
MWAGKKILLGITGGIAAYKSIHLARLIVKAGAEVQVILTPSARDFVTPLSLSALTGRPVYTDTFEPKTGHWNNHVELGLWADLMIIAPATANTLAKMANGLCDNLLLATYLSARCPVFFAPAMDLDMYAHPAVQQNIARLQSFGNYLIDSEVGPLASGLEGKGRMAEPEHILQHIEQFFAIKSSLAEKKVLINGGPTYEYIDPVRFIGNHSSGDTAVYLAWEAHNRGAEVTLVLGPTKYKNENFPFAVKHVTSAREMLDECLQLSVNANVVICSAAVADYRPKVTYDQKIKKSDQNLVIELEKNPDILAILGQSKREQQLLIGFALETENQFENARKKLLDKNADAIVLNSPSQTTGFSTPTNQVTVIFRDGTTAASQLVLKEKLASWLWDTFINTLHL